MEGRGRPSRRPRLTARERGRGTRQSRRHRPAGLPAHAPAGREPDRGPTPRPQGWRGAPAAGHDGCPGPDPRCDRHARARTGRRGGRSPARTQRRRRAGSGGGHGGGRSGPGKRVALGAGPRSGSQNRRRRGRAREKADGGEGRGAGEAVAVEEGPRPAERRARGQGGKTEPPEASRPPEHTRGLTARGLQHQGRSRSARNGDWPRRPARSSRGLGPTTHLHGQGSPAHGAGVPRRAPGARAPPNRSREHFARVTTGLGGRRRHPRGEAHFGPGRWAARPGVCPGGAAPAATGSAARAPRRRERGLAGRLPGTASGADGPPGKHTRDPTANDTRGRSHDAWDAGRPQPPFGLPRARPHRRGLREAPPPPGAAPSTQPPVCLSGLLRDPRPEGTRPRAAAAPTHARTPPPAAARDGSERRASRSRRGGARTGPGPLPTPARDGRTTRTLAHTRGPAPNDGPAGRDPPPTRRGEAPAAVGKERLCPRATVVASVATTRRGGAAAGGSGTPRHPLGSLEKAFSPRACRPRPSSAIGPTKALTDTMATQRRRDLR